MKKIIFLSLILISLFSIVSCNNNKGDYVGTWRGTVIVVNVEYEFKSNGNFVVSSFSSNDILVGGGKGKYSVDGETIILDYEKAYSYNSDDQTGEWINSNQKIEFEFKVENNELSLYEKTQNFTIELARYTS